MRLEAKHLLRGPMRHRDFRVFWIGFVTANLGTWVQTFGLGWLVVQLAVSDGAPQQAPLYLGFVGLARAVPGFGLGLVAGAVADRFSGRRILVLTQLGSAAVSTALGALALTGNLNVWGVLVLAALGASIFAFDVPTRLTMVTALVPERDLMSAVGVNQLAAQVPQVIGPALGGLLLVPLSVGGLFLVTAASYGIAAATLTQVGGLAPARAPKSVPIGRSIAQGLRYVIDDPLLRSVIVLTAVIALCARPYTFLIPAFAVTILGTDAQGMSFLLSATGLGALFGGVAVATLGGARRPGILLLGTAVAMGAVLATVALQRSLPSAILVTILLGVAMVAYSGIANTLLQTGSHESVRGRVMSIYTMVFLGMVPLGQLIEGAAGSVVGIDAVFEIAGIVTALVALLVFRNRAIFMASARRPPALTVGTEVLDAVLGTGE